MDDYEMIVEQLMKDFRARLFQNEQRITILNPSRLRQILSSGKILKKITQESEAKIQLKLHEPFESMGIIYIECSSNEFYDSKQLGTAIELADNIEIYPTANNKTHLVLAFHGLTKQIDI